MVVRERDRVMRFLLVFLAAVGALALLYASAVRLVDPHGEFGTGLFPVVEMDARAEKMRLFTAYRAKAAPTGLILGSSRAMKLRPSTLETGTGERFFNFAVDNARAEDDLAIYRWVRAHGASVKILVVGLDVEALHDDDQPDPGLVRNDGLVQALVRDGLPEPGILARVPRPGPLRTLKKYKSTFTIEYLTDAARAVRLSARPQARPLPLMEFEEDGYLRYRRWETERAAGTFRFDRDLERCLTKYLTRFDQMSTLSRRRRVYLKRLVEEARRDGARVLIWITSLHPLTARYLEAHTSYGALLQATRAYEDAIAQGDGVAVYDFSRPESYQASALGWYDCAHIDEGNADRVAAALAAGAR
jgi:hypothetical protein